MFSSCVDREKKYAQNRECCRKYFFLRYRKNNILVMDSKTATITEMFDKLNFGLTLLLNPNQKFCCDFRILN